MHKVELSNRLSYSKSQVTKKEAGQPHKQYVCKLYNCKNSSEYAQQVLNMKPFQVLVYISYVNTVANAHLFTAMFSQLRHSLLIAYLILLRCGFRNHMGVAHSYCYKLLTSLNIEEPGFGGMALMWIHADGLHVSKRLLPVCLFHLCTAKINVLFQQCLLQLCDYHYYSNFMNSLM